MSIHDPNDVTWNLIGKRQRFALIVVKTCHMSHRIYRESGNGIYWSHKTELYPDELWQKRETNHEKPVVYWCVNFRTNCNSRRRAFLETSKFSLYFSQHELHLWIYYMSKFLNTSEFIIMINSRQLLNLS